MSLADEFLDDFKGEAVVERYPPSWENKDAEIGMELRLEGTERVENSQTAANSISKLLNSQQLQHVLDEIDFCKAQGRNGQNITGPVELDLEHQLVVRANNISAEIDNEIGIIHKFARDHYAVRFPELESFVPTALEYMKIVKVLGNEILGAPKNTALLSEFLSAATIMVISVSASATQGIELTEDELNRVTAACDLALTLHDTKLQISEYIESRMSFVAPNLSLIVGILTAAQIVGAAGGLMNLSKMPACTVELLGAKKAVLNGFSTTALLLHTGHIYHSDLVQNQPPVYRKKIARIISAKCTLAARVDSFHSHPDGSIGRRLLAEIRQKIVKLLEPPPFKLVKPLKVPVIQSKRHRGGKRVRRMNKRTGIEKTKMWEAAKRMKFGEIEEDAYQEDLGLSHGRLAKLRQIQIDPKTKPKVSKTLQQKLRKMQSCGTTVHRNIAGTTSSINFTPLRGFEIHNQAAEKYVEAACAKYFSSSGGFVSV